MHQPALLDGDSALDVRGVIHGFREGDRERRVLDGVNLDVRPGEYIALLGQSGSGKSTLLHLLAGLDVPQQGEISVHGTPLSRLGETARTRFRRRHIGFVYQFFNLIPTLTVAENVLLPLELNGNGRALRGRALALLEEVGLGERLSSEPDRLSGGEQQRVALVRALAHDPALILADEPTGNLDSATGVQVMDLFDRLVHAGGRTLVVATHNVELAARADRVLRMVDGHLEELV